MRERRFVDLIDLLNIAECNQARHTEKRAEERMMELLLVLLQVQYTATAKRNNNHKPIVHHNNLQLHKSDPHLTLRYPSHLAHQIPMSQASTSLSVHARISPLCFFFESRQGVA
jgi:hypothetical protein